MAKYIDESKFNPFLEDAREIETDGGDNPFLKQASQTSVARNSSGQSSKKGGRNRSTGKIKENAAGMTTVTIDRETYERIWKIKSLLTLTGEGIMSLGKTVSWIAADAERRLEEKFTITKRK